MIIYIDNDYKCHVFNAEGRKEVETSYFDGKCQEWIESYRLVPAGETWTRKDGETFKGEMAAPWKELREAYAAQAAYVEKQNAQYEAALTAIENALEVST